jgi:Fic family protein
LIEKKNINGKRFFYLSEQIQIKRKYKKIQVYLGKNIPNDLTPYFEKLMDKEIELVPKISSGLFEKDKSLKIPDIKKIEELRIKWKYKNFCMTEIQKKRFWRRFAIQFIFESNAIEGSRLSEKEVSSIVNKHSVKKAINRKEIQEVINSLRAFESLQNDKFKLNQRSIIVLHSLLMKNLGVKLGYKKVDIVVNNKPTTSPGEVRSNMSNLLKNFSNAKRDKKYPLLCFADFHQRFERIHPFEDGNGRTGRLLFNWMLLNASYPPILFKKKNREAYFNALNQADEGRKNKWHWHVIEVYKNSVKEILQ